MKNKCIVNGILFATLFLLLIASTCVAEEIIDPIFEIEVSPETAYSSFDYNGNTYYFSSEISEQAFIDKINGIESKAKLRNGWYLWDPYQFEIFINNEREITGLDIALLTKIFNNMGIELDYSEVSWKQHQLDLKNGKRDIAAGAFLTEDRAEYVYYSLPYRKETNVLYFKKGEARNYDIESVDEMLKLFKEKKIRLGVVSGYKYGDDRINDYVALNKGSNLIIEAGDEKENFNNLFEGKIDGFLTDRIVAATVAWRHGWQSQVEEHHFKIEAADIYVIFSKDSTSPSLVNAFNKELNEFKESGEYDRTIMEYMYPVMLSQTIEKTWFIAVDVFGTFFFALAGFLLAKKEKYGLYGAFVLASLPALGGGILRDLVVTRTPLGILRTPLYIEVVAITVLSGFIISKILDHFKIWKIEKIKKISSNLYQMVQVFDNFGVAAFTIIGVVIAIDANIDPLWLWGPLLAVITCTGGGILRDTIRSDPHNAVLKGALRAEIIAIWALIFSLFLIWQTDRLNPDEILIAVLITLVGGFISHILASRYRLKLTL